MEAGPRMLSDPASLDDATLARRMTELNDEQLSDLCAAVDAAEVVARTKTIDMGASALWYATKLGWPVFPLKPRGKQPLPGSRGFKDASRDPEQVRRWWQTTPEANIGVPTGLLEAGGCGYDVVDIDGPDGIKAWAQIKHAGCAPGCSDQEFCPAPGPFDIVARAFTPGGPGRHLYIPASGDGNTARINGVSIDYRGTGGYVVAPPSVGLAGARYTWLTWPTATAAQVAA